MTLGKRKQVEKKHQWGKSRVNHVYTVEFPPKMWGLATLSTALKMGVSWEQK